MKPEWRRHRDVGYSCYELHVGKTSIAGRVTWHQDHKGNKWHWAAFNPDTGGGSTAWGYAKTMKEAQRQCAMRLR